MSTSAPPASSLKPTFEKHLDAIKWVIGLPVAILFGTTQFVDKIDYAKHPGASGMLFWIVIVNAGAIVLSFFYYFAAISAADSKLQGTPSSPALQNMGMWSFYCGFLLVVAGFGLTLIGLIHYPSFQFDKNPPPPCCCHHPSLHHLNQWSRQRPQGEPCPHLPSQSGDRRVVEDGM